MTPNLRNILLNVTERHMRHCFEEPGQPLSRERATALLPQLPLLVGLDDDLREALLSRFTLDEPIMIAGRDYLPVVEHYQTARGCSDSVGWYECSCQLIFVDSVPVAAYDDLCAHIEQANARPAVDPKAYLPLLHERFGTSAGDR